MLRLLRLPLLLLIGFAIAPVHAAADDRKPHQKLDRVLQEAVRQGSAPQRVIIRTKAGFRSALRQALRAHGDSISAEHPSIDALTAEVHGVDVAALAADPSVLSVSIDAPVSAGGRADRNPKANKRQDVDRRATALWRRSSAVHSTLRATLGLDSENVTGSGVGVAVIDSGIAPMLDFVGRITHFYDFSNGSIRAAMPFDDYGHGTHIAGLIASRSFGIASGVRLVGLKVLDRYGVGRTSDVIRAIEFVRANKNFLNVQVLNISLGHPIYEPAATDPMVQAVEAAVRDGLIVVASAGNFGRNPETGEPGYAGITSPGNAPSAITAGALNTFQTVDRSDDRVASYSSRGPTWYDAFAKPDLVAPGDSLNSDLARYSTMYWQSQPRGAGKSTWSLRLSGTSMAAGVTSGVVALVLEANQANVHWAWAFADGQLAAGAAPQLTANGVKALLQYTAIPVRDEAGNRYDALTQGGGGLNGAGAVALARAIDASKPAGQHWLSAGVDPVTTIAGRPLAWAQNIVWGANIVWGDGLIGINHPAWAANIVWGADDNIVWGADDNIVWGANIVWGPEAGAPAVWASNIVWGDSLIGLSLDDNIVWGSVVDGDNIVWGNLGDDNIVWGNLSDLDNIVWGNTGGDNIVWGNLGDDIVWGSNIVWGARREDDGGKSKGRGGRSAGGGN